MRGTICWSDEDGFWKVTDEYGFVWEVVDLDNGNRRGLLLRPDNFRYCGATWCANVAGSEHGTVRLVQDGDERDGANERCIFSETSGWEAIP